MFTISVSDLWRSTYPGAHIGTLLISGVDNSPRPTQLDLQKASLSATLRDRYANLSREELLEISILQAYRNYYKQFKKTYHVLLQLESTAHKGRPLPAINPLVDAGFMAELQTLVLTAAHDVDRLALPLCITISTGQEIFVQMNGVLQTLKPRDMIMTDATGVVCSILYGQDQRTTVTSATTHVLYVAYAPPGILPQDVSDHLEIIEKNVRWFAPGAAVEHFFVYSASLE